MRLTKKRIRAVDAAEPRYKGQKRQQKQVKEMIERKKAIIKSSINNGSNN